jgi:ankyrin repeat protein
MFLLTLILSIFIVPTFSRYQAFNLEEELLHVPLLVATFYGDLQEVQTILKDKSTRVNAVDAFGYNALHIAAWQGHPSIVKVLLSRLNPKDMIIPPIAGGFNFIDNEERMYFMPATAIMIAANYGNDQVFRELIKDGRCDMDELFNGDQTLLHLAARNGHRNIVHTLLNIGFNVNSQMTDGSTALSIAVREQHLEVVKELMKDTSINTKLGNDEGSPLLIATWNQREDIRNLLLRQYVTQPLKPTGVPLNYYL